MLVQLTDVICDTSFLIHIANTRIHNMDRLDSEIGPISFIVPNVVYVELDRLKGSDMQASRAVELASKYGTIDLGGDSYADAAIVRYVKKNGGMVATMDRKLKRTVKGAGGSVISVSNDRIVLEG